MGTPQYAKACLQRLVEEGFEIAGVYTKIDTPKNRGHKLAMSEVKEYALSVGLPVFQPTTFRDDAVVDELRALCPDLIVTAAYGKILPQRVLDIPKLGCINLHGSILPALRGPAPVQWSILNHDKEAGVTAMFMSAGMDEGDIIEIRKTPIDPEETAGALMERLADIAAGLCVDTVRAIEAGAATRTPQNAEKATYAPMLTKALSPIDWAKTASEISDQVRGLLPWPAATMTLSGGTFKVYRVEKAEGSTEAAPGTVLGLTKKGLQLACGNGEIVTVRELQAEGGKRMAAPDYFRGHPLA